MGLWRIRYSFGEIGIFCITTVAFNIYQGSALSFSGGTASPSPRGGAGVHGANTNEVLET